MAVMEYAPAKCHEINAAAEVLPIFQHWAAVMDSVEGPFRDRRLLPARLQAVYSLAREYKPEFIMQVGSHGELYAQAAGYAAPKADYLIMDEPGTAISQQFHIMPICCEDGEIVQTQLLRTEFAPYLPKGARVLLIINGHSAAERPLMEHVIRNLLRRLPAESMVIVDSLHVCGHWLDESNIEDFISGRMLKNNNNLKNFSVEYCDYWQGGSAAGLPGTHALLRYINRRGLELYYSAQGHFSCFQTAKSENPSFDDGAFKDSCQRHCFDAIDYYLDGQKTHRGLSARIKTAYNAGDMTSCTELLLELSEAHPQTDLRLLEAMCCIQSKLYPEAASFLRTCPASDKSRELSALIAYKSPHSRKRGHKTGLTVFGLPKAFKNGVAAIQKNSFKSWAALPGSPRIMLLGNDEGSGEAARELGAKYLPQVLRNEFGTPLLDSIFSLGQEQSETDVLAYVNSDIILLDDFTEAVEIARSQFDSFLMVGCRTDLDIYDEIDFADPTWQAKLMELKEERGCPYYPEGMDYFVFTQGLWPRIPAFALGRFTWDNWLVYGALIEGHAVIDATEFISAIHQNHPCVKRTGMQSIYDSTEGRRNLSFLHMRGVCNIHATYKLTADGMIEKRDKPGAGRDPLFNIQRQIWLNKQIGENLKRGRRDLAEAKVDELSQNFKIKVTI